MKKSPASLNFLLIAGEWKSQSKLNTNNLFKTRLIVWILTQLISNEAQKMLKQFEHS